MTLLLFPMKQLLFLLSICSIAISCSGNSKKDDPDKTKSETKVTETKVEEGNEDTIPKRNPVVRDLNPAQLKKLNALLPKKNRRITCLSSK